MRGDSHEALFLFKRAYQRLYAHLTREVAAATGSPPAQVSAVVHLARQDGLLVRDLGDQLALNSAGVTGLVARLEGEKLVRRVRSSTDKRAVHVQLTASGRALARRVLPTLATISRTMTDGFSPKELQIIHRFLQHVIVTFEGES